VQTPAPLLVTIVKRLLPPLATQKAGCSSGLAVNNVSAGSGWFKGAVVTNQNTSKLNNSYDRARRRIYLVISSQLMWLVSLNFLPLKFVKERGPKMI